MAPRVSAPVPAAFGCLPRFAGHLVRRPYRDRLPVATAHRSGSRLRDAVLTAAYDTLVGLVLRAYAELEGVRLPASAGGFAVRFNRLGCAFDDEVERGLLADGGISWRCALRGAEVVARLRDLQEYAVLHGHAGRVDRARELMLAELDAGYARYVALTLATGPAAPVERVLSLAMLDTGGHLRCLATALGVVFTGSAPAEATAGEFAAFGVLAKIVDDFRDIAADHRAGRANLLLACLHENPVELREFEAVAGRAEGLGPQWWRRHCATALGRYQDALAVTSSSITARPLRTAGELMAWTAWSRGRRARRWSASRM